MTGTALSWQGYGPATQLLIVAHQVRGDELLQEVERLKVMEVTQLSIEAETVKRKQDAGGGKGPQREQCEPYPMGDEDE